jgi:transketolase
VPIRRIGINDSFGESARDEEIELLMEKYELTSTKIAQAVVDTRRRIKK